MPVLFVLFVLIVVAIGMWFVNNKIPYITPGWKLVINWVVGICVAWWLIFGVFGVNMASFGTVPRVGAR